MDSASSGYQTHPEDKMEQSECVGGNVCACSLVRGFSSGYPRDCGGSGTQLVGTDVGLWDMDRGAM